MRTSLSHDHTILRIIPTEIETAVSDRQSGPTRGRSLFEFEDVRVVLGGHLALRVDRLALSGGELVGLIGANGAGKTTLLRLLAGLTAPTAGVLRARATDVAYVSQHHGHHRWMPLSVDDVLMMGRYRARGLLGRFRAEDRRAVATAAARLEVADLSGRGFDTLSGGQRQRVLIASALAAGAPCLLLDEPITGLDLPSQQIILDAARTERDAGRLVVMSTHHLDEAAACDRVLVLATDIVADGPPQSSLRPEPLQTAFGRRVRVTADDDGRNVLVLDDHGHDHDHDHDHDDGATG